MQQTNEKMTEPSMEDILASIRKIISEEPATSKSAAKPGPVPLSPIARAAPPPTPVPPAPVAVTPASAAAEAPRPSAPVSAPPSPPAASPAATSRLSDFMRELAPAAVPISTVAASTFHDDLSDLVDEPAPPAAAKPSVTAQKAETPVPPSALFEPVVPSPEPRAAAPSMPAAPVTRTPDPKPADLGAFIPTTAKSLGLLTPRNAPMPAAPAAPVLKMPEVGVPVMPVAAVAPPPAVTEDAESDPVAAAQSALGALAMGLATPPVATAPAPGSDVAVYGAEAAAPVARKTLDDTIVDMLRPMIGDWLDEHLPEMVEKALRQELAERGKSGR